MTDGKQESDIESPWKDPYHPDINFLAQLETLQGRMDELVENIGTKTLEHRRELLGAYKKLSHEIEGLEENEIDIDELVIKVWRETACTLIDEPGKHDFITSLDNKSMELLDSLAQDMGAESMTDLRNEDVKSFVDKSISDITEELEQRTDQIHITGSNAYDVLSYFTAAASVIEYRSAWIIHDKFIDDRFVGKEGTWKLLRGPAGFNQKQREQWLLRTAVISNSLHSKMSELREMRNSLIHDPYAPHIIWAAPNDISEKGRRGLEAAKELTEIMESG